MNFKLRILAFELSFAGCRSKTFDNVRTQLFDVFKNRRIFDRVKMFKFLKKDSCFYESLNPDSRRNYDWVRRRNKANYIFYVLQYGQNYDKKKIIFSKQKNRDIFEHVKNPIYRSEPDLSKF